ncbi:MAG: hypothetical protein AABZ53_05340 [Planctomycetota bacterium]
MSPSPSPNRSIAGSTHAAPSKPQDNDPEFGALLAERRVSFMNWLIVLIVGALAAGSLVFMVSGLWLWLSPNNGPALNPQIAPPPPANDWQIALVGFGLSFAFGSLTFFAAREALTKTRFHELGVRTVRFGKGVRAMAYADCERFWFTLVRQYVHGVYAGTALTITLKARGKPTIKWSGSHKEKPKGLSVTILGKGEFKGEDELDIVKLVIADAMADRWVGEMSDGLSKNWCGKLALGIDNAGILSGKRKGQEVPYQDLDRVAFKKGTFHLFHVGDEKSCVSIAMIAENFWPGFRVLERMWMIAAPDREMGTELEGEEA